MPAAWPVLQRANSLRRRAVGRLRALDMVQWDAVPYGPHPRQCLHLWELNDLCPRDGWPAVLLVHGGGWIEGQWQDFESQGPAWCRRGVMAAAMNYRLAPDHRWPDPLDDVLAALDFLHGQQVDPDRIALWGHSAGGQLALMAALRRPELVSCVVALGAPSDLRTMAAEGGLGAQTLPQAFADEDLAAASPIAVDCPEPPPILLVHGSADRVVDVEQARAHRRQRPDNVGLIEVPDGDHGLRWPPRTALKARRQAMDWVMHQLAPAERKSKWKARKKKKR